MPSKLLRALSSTKAENLLPKQRVYIREDLVSGCASARNRGTETRLYWMPYLAGAVRTDPQNYRIRANQTPSTVAEGCHVHGHGERNAGPCRRLADTHRRTAVLSMQSSQAVCFVGTTRVGQGVGIVATATGTVGNGPL